jgi:hypothetical protein
MTGVEILSSETVYETAFHSWPFFVSGGIIGLVFIIVFVYNLIEGDFGDAICASVCSVILSFVILIWPTVIIAEHDTTEISYIEHKALITDEVIFSEFTEKYKIADQEGKIYTIREYPVEE